jgi:hypothetical protein
LSWLRNRKPSEPTTRHRTRGATPRRSPFRPRLEALEDRCVPSTLHVTNYSDSASVKGSLRYEIAHAGINGRDTIAFDNTVRGTLNLSSQLNITVGVTIQGPGANVLTLTTNYNFGDPWGQSTRVFEVNASRPVAISGLTISDNGVNGDGAAILNHSALTVSGCNVSNNGASYGGGIANYGSLTLSGCTLSYNGADHWGGGIYNAGALTVRGCTLSFNRDFFDYAIYNSGTLTVSTSTFVANGIYGSYTDGGGNHFITGQPQIGSFTASAGTVSAGSSLTLTLTSITDPNPGASITEVVVYHPNTVGGTPLGYAVQTSPGVWTLTFSTTNWAAGTDTFYAEVVDSYGTYSVATGPTVQVN